MALTDTKKAPSYPGPFAAIPALNRYMGTSAPALRAKNASSGPVTFSTSRRMVTVPPVVKCAGVSSVPGSVFSCNGALDVTAAATLKKALPYDPG